MIKVLRIAIVFFPVKKASLPCWHAGIRGAAGYTLE